MDADVVVIGSGFGGAVAALRFAELGESVVVIERGDWVVREKFRTDLDFFWIPERDAFGMNDIQRRGKTILPWLGSAVGGGSHVYAGTLKRSDSFTGYPSVFSVEDMKQWYDRAEQLMLPTTYPTYAPYGDNGALLALRTATRHLALREPQLIADRGLVKLAISFVPEGGNLDGTFTNPHGAEQRYHHPHEQSILGGDIGAKNTLDKNYLHLATARGAVVKPMTEVTRIEPVDGGWKITHRTWHRSPSRGARWIRRWIKKRADFTEGSTTARRVVVAAGSIGSTELLMRARDVDRTLPDLSPVLGTKYTTNGDFLSLVVPTRGSLFGFIGLAAIIAGLVMAKWWVGAIGFAVYWAWLLWTRELAADLGTTNSDYVRFRAEEGVSDCVYIESGRYPTPGRLLIAVALGWLGQYRPWRYRKIVVATRYLTYLVPPIALMSRVWPIPLLKMGRDRAFGNFRLDANGRATIDYDLAANERYYKHLEFLGKKLARASGGLWLPNLMHRATKMLEVPHNQGGVPIGESPADGVVDHAGRVFGYDNLLVLDGSILPTSPGPNPAFTILAVSERAMSIVAAQIARDGTVSATARQTAAPASASA